MREEQKKIEKAEIFFHFFRIREKTPKISGSGWIF